MNWIKSSYYYDGMLKYALDFSKNVKGKIFLIECDKLFIVYWSLNGTLSLRDGEYLINEFENGITDPSSKKEVNNG